MSPCPKSYESPPSWYAPTSVSVGFMTIPFAVYTFHVIYSCTPNSVDKRYKNYILLFHTVVCMGSILNALSAHIQYMPALLFITNGPLSFDPHLDSYFDILFQIYVCICAGLPVLHRFLVITGLTDSKFYKFILIGYISSCASPFTIATVYFHSIYRQEEAVRILRERCPKHFRLTEDYEIAYAYDETIVEWTMNILVSTIAVLLVTATVILSLSFYLLKKKKSNFSEATKRLQLKLLHNIIIQLGIPTMVHGIPSGIGAIIVSNNWNPPLYVSLIIWLVGSFHGIFNCLIFMLLNDFYFKKLKRDLRSFPIVSTRFFSVPEQRLNKVDTTTAVSQI